MVIVGSQYPNTQIYFLESYSCNCVIVIPGTNKGLLLLNSKFEIESCIRNREDWRAKRDARLRPT